MSKGLSTEIKRRSGRRREGRFNSALWALHPQRPWWYLGTRLATVEEDINGVDFVAVVVYSQSRIVMNVPVQLKSSRDDFVDYYRKHPYARGQHILELAVGNDADLHSVARDYAGRLTRICAREIDYRPYFGELSRIVRNEEHNIKLRKRLEKERANDPYPLRLPPMDPTPLWICVMKAMGS